MFKYLKTYYRILQQDRAFRRSFFSNFFFLAGKVLLQPFTKRSGRMILISLTEHMGDLVAAEPISRHLRNKYPDARIYWVVNGRFAEIVQHNRALNGILTVTCIAEWVLLKKLIGPMIMVFDLHVNGRSCSKYKLTNKNPSKNGMTIFNYLERGNLLDVFAATGGITDIADLNDQTPEFHFSADKSDEVVFPFNYVVFHPESNDPERNWTSEQWNLTLDYILSTYPDLHVVEVGLRSVIFNDSPRFHNITGKYNLQQLAFIIRRAALFIGVESGFAHFANALGPKSIVLIGYYQHYRNYQVYSGRFAAGVDVILYYHPGKLQQLQAHLLKPSIDRQLGINHNRKLMRS
jgi:ADP-heptose:LPS heptosyltransferase